MHVIERFDESQIRQFQPQLIALLRDAVDNGASVGFLRPLDENVARNYWNGLVHSVASGSRILLVARDGDAILGSVQLDLCLKQNGRHRAEVQKLLVLTRCRRRGIGTAIMRAIEREATAASRTLLYLDTEPDQPAERMYESQAWVRAGAIPDYACTPDGRLHPTTIFYKKI